MAAEGVRTNWSRAPLSGEGGVARDGMAMGRLRREFDSTEKQCASRRESRLELTTFLERATRPCPAENNMLPICSLGPPHHPPTARTMRLAKFKREQLIVDYLNRGLSVAEIAARVGVGEKRMRAIIREILARRMPHPPDEFVAIRVSRLNEALLVAFSGMSGANLRAVDRVVKIVRELDRYGGIATRCIRRRNCGAQRGVGVQRATCVAGR